MRVLMVFFLMLPWAAHAADAFELERVERSCKLQRESLLVKRRGTPACDELKRLKAEGKKNWKKKAPGRGKKGY